LVLPLSIIFFLFFFPLVYKLYLACQTFVEYGNYSIRQSGVELDSNDALLGRLFFEVFYIFLVYNDQKLSVEWVR
jgi:hypothetical protein